MTLAKPASPGGAQHRDRRALVAVASQFFVNGAVFGSVGPRLPEIRDQVGITASQVGLMMSIAGLGGLIGSAAAGRSIARFGSRRVMLTAATVVAMALPLVGVAGGPVVLAIGLMMLMTFDVPVDVAMNLQGSWLSARRSIPVMNRLHGLWSLGTVAGGVMSSQLAQAGVPIRNHLFGASAVLLILLALISRGLLTTDESAVAEDPQPGAHRNEPSRTSASLSGRPRRVGLVLLGLAGYTALAVEATSLDWPAFRFTDDLGTSPSTAAWAYVAVTGGMTLGRFAGDSAAVALGKERLVDVAIVVNVVGLVLATMVDTVAAGLIGYAAAGIGVSVFLPEIYDQAAKFPGRPGSGLGALTAGLRLAALTVPLLVGALIATVGTIGGAVALCAIPSAFGFGAVARLGRRIR